MNGGLRLPLNLATRPLRNRRLYRAVLGGLIVLFLLVGGAASFFLLRAVSQERADSLTSARLELSIQKADRERADKAGRGEALRKRNVDFISQVNGVIARKNFSWVDFFSRLENALPPDCSIAAVNPLELSGTTLSVTMKVITPGVPGLLTLIENLAGQKFKSVTMRSEVAGGGRLISEIGFVYDGSR